MAALLSVSGSRGRSSDPGRVGSGRSGRVGSGGTGLENADHSLIASCCISGLDYGVRDSNEDCYSLVNIFFELV